MSSPQVSTRDGLITPDLRFVMTRKALIFFIAFVALLNSSLCAQDLANKAAPGSDLNTLSGFQVELV